MEKYASTEILNESGKAGQNVARRLLITYVNCAAFGDSYSTAPSWVAVGHGVEDSSLEYSVSSTTKTDIFDNTETNVEKIEISQSFDPMTLKKGNPLQAKLIDIMERKAKEELALFECLVVRAYMEEKDGENTVYHAEKHKGCTITPQREGGSAYVDMPITINFSNDKVLGTVDKLDNSLKFTELGNAKTEE